MRTATGFSVGVLVAASVPMFSPATALSDSCSYDPTTHTVSISYSGPAAQGEAENEVKVVAGQITFENTACSGATVSNTDTINATGGGGRDLFSVDIGGGLFAPGFTDEGDGTSEIEIHVNPGGGGTDVVKIDGTALRDLLVAGADGLNLNGDSDADVFLSATEVVGMFGYGGNDVLTARGGFGTGEPAGTRATLVGRGGNDRLLGGRRPDDLVGARGRDIAKGGRGGDLLVGQGDADKLFGEGQNDFLVGGGGNDRLVGGSGTDMCRQGPGTGPVRSCEKP
jgi:Ca2+-binding RTX toxin-like protein